MPAPRGPNPIESPGILAIEGIFLPTASHADPSDRDAGERCACGCDPVAAAPRSVLPPDQGTQAGPPPVDR